MKTLTFYCSYIFILAFSALLALELHAGQSVTDPYIEPVTLQLRSSPGFIYAGYYAAIEQGFYLQEGLDVSVTLSTKTDKGLQNILSEQVNYAVAGSSLIAHYANGAKIKILAALFQHLAVNGIEEFSEHDGITNNSLMDSTRFDVDFYGEILYTSQAEIIRNPGRAQRFRRATLKGWHYALANPQQLIQLIHHDYHSESSIASLTKEAAEIRKHILPNFIELGSIDSRRLQQIADIYAEHSYSPAVSEQELRNFILQFSAPLQFTQQEQQWLKQHSVVRLGVDSAYAPYEWIDEDGQYQGLTADYIKLIKQKLAIRFEIVKGYSWPEQLAMAKRGELDMFALIAETPERSEYLDFSSAYLTNPMVIINARPNSYIGSLAKLSGKTIAVEDGYFTHEYLRNNYPTINLLIVDSTASALAKVSSGEADAYFGDAAYANFHIKKSQLLNLQFAGQADFNVLFRMGVIKSKPELLSLINKALNSIEYQQRSEIEARWLDNMLTRQVGIDPELIIKVATVVAVVFIIFLIHHFQVIRSRSILQKVQGELLLYEQIYQQAQEGVVISDADHIIIDVNPAFTNITGFSRDEVMGKETTMLRYAKQGDEFYQQMWKIVEQKGFWQGELWNNKKDGNLYATLLAISALKDEHSKVKHFVGIFTDITANKQQHEKLEMMAHYDVLTNLPNRVLFSDHFSMAIAHSKRHRSLLAVCFIDLDNFKIINDNFGHDAGDQLLIEVAKRIKSTLRDEDTVSRLGGDEFALLLGELESLQQCEQIMTRILYLLAEPYVLDGENHEISASSGITIYPLDNSEADTLLRHADHAMYQAKQAGRNRYHVFNTQQEQQLVFKHHQLKVVSRALADNEFELYYQPKVNMRSGKVYGTEALIRWIHPVKGVIAPLDFLPIIETSDIEVELGYWVIEQALIQLLAWKNQAILLEVSVNISSYHLLSESFVDKVAALLKKYSMVEPVYLQLEILESSALGNLEDISRIIKSCRRELGIGIALDDFGTGYSSLTHLRNLSVGMIKIDQSFVSDLLEDPEDFAIIDGILALAYSFSHDVIAEGVEQSDQGLMLLLMGCEKAQGYGIAKPMPAQQLPNWLDHYQPNEQWLNCMAHELNLKQKKVQILSLVTQKWMQHFEQEIISQPESIEYWPIMDKTKCQCGMWISREQRDSLFEPDYLNTLEQVHDGFHRLAYDLLLQYQEGEIEHCQKGMIKLQAVFVQFSDYIKYQQVE